MPTKAAECLAEILEGDKDGFGVLSWRDHARALFAVTIHSGDQAARTDPLNSSTTLADAGTGNFVISFLFKREALCSRMRAVLFQTAYLDRSTISKHSRKFRT